MEFFVVEDRVTGKQSSLKTRDKTAAHEFLAPKTSRISNRPSTCKSPARI
jgi:hypothetical protein